jgi:hypothetical protein
MNTIIPQAWIIQQKKRQDEERRRKESESTSVPLSLPNDFDIDDEYFERGEAIPETPPKSTVIIIDL